MSRSLGKRLNTWAWEGLASAVTPTVLCIHVLAAALVGYFVGAAGTERAKQAVVDTAGESLSRFAETLAPGATAQTPALQEALQAIDESTVWEDLRVIATGGEILASLRVEQVGTKHWQTAELRRKWPEQLTTVWEDRDHQLLERVILRTPLAAAPQDRKMILEGVVRLESLLPPVSMFNDQRFRDPPSSYSLSWMCRVQVPLGSRLLKMIKLSSGLKVP